MIGREELLALAAQPIYTGKRALKVWLPLGKISVPPAEARAIAEELKARNFDLEDAVEAAGGQRGALRS